jgi:hypothetical protein
MDRAKCMAYEMLPAEEEGNSRLGTTLHMPAGFLHFVNSSGSLPLRLAADLVCVLVLAYLLYFRRYERHDLAFVYVAFNLGVFSAVAVISGGKLTAAVGFGLFGILSIVRLRSEPFDNVEIGYFFLALVLALVNGLAHKAWIAALLDVALLGMLLFGDLRRHAHRVRTQTVTLDRVFGEETALASYLEQQLGAEIVSVTPFSSDYVRDMSVVTVRYRRTVGADG